LKSINNLDDKINKTLTLYPSSNNINQNNSNYLNSPNSHCPNSQHNLNTPNSLSNYNSIPNLRSDEQTEYIFKELQKFDFINNELNNFKIDNKKLLLENKILRSELENIILSLNSNDNNQNNVDDDGDINDGNRNNSIEFKESNNKSRIESEDLKLMSYKKEYEKEINKLEKQILEHTITIKNLEKSEEDYQNKLNITFHKVLIYIFIYLLIF